MQDCRAPYGYIFDGDNLAVTEAEAVIVRMIYQWYITGDDETHEPMTDYAIAQRFSEMGVPTPGEKVNARRIRQSGMWGYATVRRFLTTETYAGVFQYGKWGSYEKGTKRKVRPIDQLITVKVPAIVSREVWEAAQVRRGHNKRISGTKRYLLRGLVTCGCGRKMRGGTCYRANHLRYRCNSDQTYFAELEAEQKNCYEKTVNGKVLESVVWNYVVGILTDPVRFQAAWRKAQTTERSSLAPKRERLESINELIKHCEQEAIETAEALKKAKGLILAKLEADQDAINDRYAKLTAERENLIGQVRGTEQFTDEALERALQFRTDVIEGLKSPTFDDTRLYLELLQGLNKVP